MQVSGPRYRRRPRCGDGKSRTLPAISFRPAAQKFHPGRSSFRVSEQRRSLASAGVWSGRRTDELAAPRTASGAQRKGTRCRRHLFRDSDVLLVEMGHTHYNELANDGRVIYAATRSTGQIEEGPAGFSVTTLDDCVVSWEFKPIGE